jgi:hypothetical protein
VPIVSLRDAIARFAARRSVRMLTFLLAFASVAYGVNYVVRRAPGIQHEQPLQVQELIEAVRTELAAAEASRRQRGDLPLFRLKDFEMEISYLVRNSGGAKAEVVGVGTNLDALSERVQKLRLRWEAIPERDERIPSSMSLTPMSGNTLR